ncbi:MAG: tyrosine--tRNA ligase [Planctomycetes bacterium]|nr:tyrosine--tRNA ligase [Planctomycetota bacterium]
MTHPHLETVLRGTAAVYSPDELARKLAKSESTGKPLRVKLGLDPSSPDIHLGHTVVLGLMRRFQDLGHKAVLIIGDYTARIGDPTGKSKTRPMLTPEQIEENAQTYLDQATLILDDDPAKLELRRNSEWLAEMSFADVIRLACQVTVARMMERDTFETRYKAGLPISVHEFLYPLMQGWDSVCIEADIELGGTDQTFNNLVGRDLQQNAGQEPQVVMVCPILRGMDGTEKMSKSLGNYIGVTESADEMFGKTMSIPDELMHEWFELCTSLDATAIGELCNAETTHPREAKDRLGRAIVQRFHGAGAGDQASAEFTARFRDGQLPSDMETVNVSSAHLTIIAVMREAGFASSNGEARRLVQQGAVSINDEKVTDPQAEVGITNGDVLKVGKRRVCQLAVGG